MIPVIRIYGQHDRNARKSFVGHLRSPVPKDKRDVYLISDVLPFGRLLYGDQTLPAIQSGRADEFERLAESQIGRDFGISIAHALVMFFEKFRELGFGDAIMKCLERLPNFFAASEGSGIVQTRLMAERI